jgi:hypothetical protein
MELRAYNMASDDELRFIFDVSRDGSHALVGCRDKVIRILDVP